MVVARSDCALVETTEKERSRKQAKAPASFVPVHPNRLIARVLICEMLRKRANQEREEERKKEARLTPAVYSAFH